MAKYLFTFKGTPEKGNDYEAELYALSGEICEAYLTDTRAGANVLEAYFESGEYTVFAEELTAIDESSLAYRVYLAGYKQLGPRGYILAENYVNKEPEKAILLLLGVIGF